MSEREKVIEGLEVCRDQDNPPGYRFTSCADDCPYHGNGCARKLKEDALALLKEQEDLGTELTNAVELIHKKNERIEKLLKDQEAVEPKTEPSAKGYWYTCGACGWWLFEVRDTVHFDDRKRIRFCASCGQAVKWE